MQYLKPLARAGHKAVFNPTTNEIFMYGGRGYVEENPVSYSNTWMVHTKSDLWYYNIHNCINNCSNHGLCYYGFCLCNAGFYGQDCSNITCPGTFCSYDDFTFKQSCIHGCTAGYVHYDNETYVQDISKIPCSVSNPGELLYVCLSFCLSFCLFVFSCYVLYKMTIGHVDGRRVFKDFYVQFE